MSFQLDDREQRYIVLLERNEAAWPRNRWILLVGYLAFLAFLALSVGSLAALPRQISIEPIDSLVMVKPEIFLASEYTLLATLNLFAIFAEVCLIVWVGLNWRGNLHRRLLIKISKELLRQAAGTGDDTVA